MRFSPVDDIISTKLCVPILKESMLFRPRLEKLFLRGWENRIILVTAPAGYGKSTAVAQLLLQQASTATAWLSLDEDDNDPVRYWRYIIHSLNRVHAGIGEQSLEALQRPGIPLEKALTILINEINHFPEDIFLVLDDYYLIQDETIQQSMAFFLKHSPSQLHICIISRETPPLPLSLYRARGKLLELTGETLAFTDQEISAYFNTCLNLEIPAEIVNHLNRYLEGWIAGFYMLSLALKNNHDTILLPFQDLSKEMFFAGFMVEEVLDKQPGDIRRFLLFTSIVEHFTPALGEVLSGVSPGKEIIEQVSRAQLYLLPLDREGKWYRYHHLFRDILRDELRKRHPDSIPALYLQAGRWFAGEGYISDAVTYMLKAEAYSEAGNLIEKHAPKLFRTGQLKTLGKWIQSYPEQALRERPILRLLQIWINIFAGRFAVAAKQVEFLGAALYCPDGVSLSTEDKDALRDDLLITRCFLSFIQGKPEAPQEYLALSQHFSGKGFLLRQIIPFNLHASALQGESGMRGNLRKAAEFYEWIIPQVGESIRQYPTSAIGYIILVEIACEKGQLEKALHHIKTVLRLCAQAEEPGILVPAYLAYARVKLIQGEYGAAQELISTVAKNERVSTSPRWSCILEAQRVRFALRLPDRQRLRIADEWLTRWGLKPGDEISPLQEFEYTTLLRVLLAKGQPDQALTLAERLLPGMELEGSIGGLIELRLLQALGWSASGQTANALAALETALSLAEEHGYYRLLLDEGAPLMDLLREYYEQSTRLSCTSLTKSKLLPYVRQLIDAFPGDTQPEETPELPETQEPLTRREKEIVKLLAAGQTNQEISAELFISPTTVKTHLRNIYRKLNVSNRMQAVTRANLLKFK